MEQYGSIINAFWNTLKLAFVGDVDYNNFTNMENPSLSLILVIVVIVLVPVTGLNTLIAIISEKYEKVMLKKEALLLKIRLRFIIQ